MARWSARDRAHPAFILGYHRICPWQPGSGFCEPTWNVSPARFRQQLQGVLRAGYVPLRLAELARRVALGEEWEMPVFAVTFDDAYATIASEAWEVLASLEVPATVFVPTACLDRPAPMPFDDWSAKGAPKVPVEFWRCLTSNECRTLLASGWFEFGSHTHAHADYRYSPELFDADLHMSVATLGQAIGVTPTAFSYPYGVERWGFCNPKLREVLRQTGFTCALTWEPNRFGLDQDRYAWGRIPVQATDTPAQLVGKMNRWYGPLRGAWRSVTAPLRPCPPPPQPPAPDWWCTEHEVAS